MKRITASWIGVLCSLMVAIPGMAQTVTGTIRGTITDQSGAIVQGAKVTAVNVATGVQTAATTNQAGEYSIRFLQIGQYKITVEASGFQTANYGPFALEIDQVAKVDVPLQIGASTSTITVSGSAQPILQTESPTNGETFTENTINSMPLNGRDFSQMTVFTPGAVSTGYGVYGAVSGSASNSSERSTNDSNEANVNGSRQQSNNYLLDGQEINENINNTIGYSPSPDSLQEVHVIASNANAEFGNVNGGEVVMVTKSGTNRLHGSAFGFLSNDNLNANTWVNDQSGAPKAAYTQSIFGGTIGGPIFKDRLFFFADYQGFRYHSSGQTAFSLAPPQFLTGDLSQVLTGLGIQLYDTQNLNAAGQPTPYPNNQIPVVNPVAQFLASHPNAYPAPNNTANSMKVDPMGILNNFIGPQNVFSRNDQGDIKIDWHLHDRDVISSRYSQGYAQDATVSDPVPVQFPSGSNYPDHLGTITWTHTASPAVVNNARASYARIQFNSGITIDPSGIFGLNGNATVGIPSNPQLAAGFSQQSFFGIGGTTSNQNGYPNGFGANPTPEVFVDNVFEYADDLTWQRNKHLFKFGVEFTRYQQNSFYPGNDGELGDFTYNGQFSGISRFYPFADFLLDRVYDVQIGDVTGLTGQRQWRDGVFAQDDWKVSEKLTLNLGMRWEYDQPIYEVNNKMANVNMTTKQIIYAGVDGNSRALYNPDYAQFQPRFGFAYQITPRWVVRGGYGITSYLEGMGANLRLTQNPPFHTDFEQQGLNPTIESGVVTSKGTYYQAANGFPTTSPPTTTFYVWPQDLKPSSTQEAALTTEYQLTPSSTFQVGYVGILGHHLTQPYWGNQLTAPGATAPYANIVGQTGVVKISQTEGASNYNALQAVYRQHLMAGLELTANYTYAKSLTDNYGYYGVTNTSGQYYQQDAYDPAAEWGPSGFDIRHSLSMTGVYDLPFGRGKRFGANWNRFIDTALGGWKLSGTDVTYSGFPVTASSPANYSSTVFAFTGAARPNQLRPLKVQGEGHSIKAYWGTYMQSGGAGYACGPDTDNGTCVFQQQSNSGFGALRPFALRGPGFEQIDMSVAKAFTVWHEQHFDFRGDFFNAFNIVSYRSPDATVSDANFGQITNTNSTERHIQLSLKYVF